MSARQDAPTSAGGPHIEPAAAYVIFAGASLAVYTGRLLWLGHRSTEWPSAVGAIVTSSTAIGVLQPEGGENPSPGASVRTTTVVYPYNVTGQRYFGSRVGFTPFPFRESLRAVRHYQPEHGVRVAYEPRDAKRSVLEPGTSAPGVAAFVGALALTLCGVVWMITMVV